MDFIAKNIKTYAEEHTSSHGQLLHQLHRETYEKVLIPRMISGPLQGRFLAMISHMLQPKNILEIGTYTGYSALCLAEGLAADGTVHTIDKNEELETMIRRYVDASDYNQQIKLHIGNALEIIPTLDLDFDLVFIDADKTNYLNYYKLLIDKMKPNSYLLADNVLWSGKVVGEIDEGDVDSMALNAFNKAIQDDDRVENVLLPLRDGLMLLRVK